MRRFLPATIVAAILALCGGASAGQIWTDGDGDGLPDSGPLPATPSTNVTVGVWIDAQSFTWTNYLACLDWSDCFSYVSASYVITGGSNFPIDVDPPRPYFCFGGSDYNEGGVDHIANLVLHVNSIAACCVTPIIDIYNPYYAFSQLGAGSAYMLFTTNPGTCYGTQEAAGACCFPDGSCQQLSGPECAGAGGVYQGDGVTCVEANCPQPPLGACCLPQFCVITTEADCAARGGVYRGDGTNCDPPGCDINAAESKSWGKIKGLFR